MHRFHFVSSIYYYIIIVYIFHEPHWGVVLEHSSVSYPYTYTETYSTAIFET